MILKEKLARGFAFVSATDLQDLNNVPKPSAVWKARYDGYTSGFEKAREMARDFIDKSIAMNAAVDGHDFMLLGEEDENGTN